MEKVFLVMCTGYFGDVILTSKLTRDIKKNYPNSKLIYICDTPYVSVAKCLPGVDFSVGYDRKSNSNPLNYLKFVLKFPFRGKIDSAFIIHQNKKSRNILAKHLGTKNVIAWEHFKASSQHQKILSKDEKYLNIAYFNANMLSVLTNEKTDDKDIEFLIPDSTQQKIDGMLSGHEHKRLVGVNPQAGDREKCWDIQEFVKFMKLLIKEGFTPVVTGVSKDGPEYIDAIANDSELDSKDYIIMVDQTNFVELGALYKRCSCVVSIDTGSAHMASAVGVSTLVLFFRNDAYLWAPINTEQNSYIYNAGFISADEVFSKMRPSCYNTPVES